MRHSTAQPIILRLTNTTGEMVIQTLKCRKSCGKLRSLQSGPYVVTLSQENGGLVYRGVLIKR
ncbi:MAG: hypothetical protein IPP69_08855 [Flavobacteriales bacterium]|nr:hypothetical protein [Flavobacteriales bacterium]